MRVLALLLVAGCDKLWDLDVVHLPADAPGLGDTSLPLDAGPCIGGTAYGRNGPGGEGLLSVCLTSATPVPDTLLLQTPINTGESLCSLHVPVDTDGTMACVMLAKKIVLEGAAAGTGGRLPLVLLATETIYINDKLDLSAHNNGTVGAGSDWIDPVTMVSRCGLSPGASNIVGGSGGAGGSNGQAGAAGGSGKSAGGQPTLPFPLPTIHGGCPGSNGGDADVSGGIGASGGGAVYMIAGIDIVLSTLAVINASGAGGTGGQAASISGGTNGIGGGGGGGGGAGGLIGLDAPMITIVAAARLCANGGGGGSGGALTEAGLQGAEPVAGRPGDPAPGGAQTGDASYYGGKGGNGYALQNPTVGGSRGSGGGGGGGAGVIAIYAKNKTVTLGNISPLPLMP